jgi:hypothetical protein
MGTWRLRAAVSTVAIAVMALAWAAAADAQTPATAASYQSRLGVGTHMRTFPQKNMRYELQRISASGIKWIREDFSWPQIEPFKGQWDWHLTDELMTAASSAQLSVLPIANQSPMWASSDPSGAGGSTWPPRANADYARFVAAIVERYGPGGAFWRAHPELAPKPIGAVQIWNEPWGFFSWKPEPNPGAYAALAKAAATAVNARNPSIKVLVAGDVLQSRADKSVRPWLADLLKVDPSLPPLVDAWAVSTYPGPRTQGPYQAKSRPEWNFGRVQMVRDMTVAAGAARPIWLTEMGWSTGPDDPERVSEATQAHYVRDAARRAVEEWGTFVERAFVYSWDRPMDAADFKVYGLRRDDDSVRPAWTELSNLARFGPAPRPPNLPPVAGFRTDVPNPQAWDKMTFYSTSKDPDGFVTSQAWDLDGDGYFDDDWRSQAGRVFKYPGNYRVRLRVTDMRGAQSIATWIVPVARRDPGR